MGTDLAQLHDSPTRTLRQCLITAMRFLFVILLTIAFRPASPTTAMQGQSMSLPCNAVSKQLTIGIVLENDVSTQGTSSGTLNGLLVDQAKKIANTAGFRVKLKALKDSAAAALSLQQNQTDVIAGAAGGVYFNAPFETMHKSPPTHIAPSAVFALRGKQKSVDLWLQWFIPFEAIAWASIGGSFFVYVGVFWVLESRYNKKHFPPTLKGWIAALYHCWKTMLNGLSSSEKPVISALARAVVLTWNTIMMIIFATYVASVVLVLSSQIMVSEISGNSELAASGSPVCTT